MNDLEIVGLGIIKLDDIKAEKQELETLKGELEALKKQQGTGTGATSEEVKQLQNKIDTIENNLKNYYTKSETDKKISEITFEKDTLESETRSKIQSLIKGV